LTTDQALAASGQGQEFESVIIKERQALVDREAEMMRKIKEQEKKKEKNIEAIIGDRLKEGHIMKGSIKYQNDAKYSQVKSKIGVVYLFFMVSYD